MQISKEDYDLIMKLIESAYESGSSDAAEVAYNLEYGDCSIFGNEPSAEDYRVGWRDRLSEILM